MALDGFASGSLYTSGCKVVTSGEVVSIVSGMGIPTGGVDPGAFSGLVQNFSGLVTQVSAGLYSGQIAMGSGEVATASAQAIATSAFALATSGDAARISGDAALTSGLSTMTTSSNVLTMMSGMGLPTGAGVIQRVAVWNNTNVLGGNINLRVISNQVTLGGGTNANPIICFSGRVDSGIYSSGGITSIVTSGNAINIPGSYQLSGAYQLSGSSSTAKFASMYCSGGYGNSKDIINNAGGDWDGIVETNASGTNLLWKSGECSTVSGSPLMSCRSGLVTVREAGLYHALFSTDATPQSSANWYLGILGASGVLEGSVHYTAQSGHTSPMTCEAVHYCVTGEKLHPGNFNAGGTLQILNFGFSVTKVAD